MSQSIRHRAGRFGCAHPDCQLRHNDRGAAIACCSDRPLPGDLVADGGTLEEDDTRPPEPDLPERPEVRITRHHRRGDPEPWLIIRSADDPSCEQRLSIHECDLVEVPR